MMILAMFQRTQPVTRHSSRALRLVTVSLSHVSVTDTVTVRMGRMSHHSCVVVSHSLYLVSLLNTFSSDNNYSMIGLYTKQANQLLLEAERGPA